MKLKHSIAPELASRWLPVIERQFDLTLAPLEISLKQVSVGFSVVGENGSTTYRCEVSGTTAAGGEFNLSNQHRDGRVAITDVFSRARREVARSRQRPFTPLRRTDATEPSR